MNPSNSSGADSGPSSNSPTQGGSDGQRATQSEQGGGWQPPTQGPFAHNTPRADVGSGEGGTDGRPTASTPPDSPGSGPQGRGPGGRQATGSAASPAPAPGDHTVAGGAGAAPHRAGSNAAVPSGGERHGSRAAGSPTPPVPDAGGPARGAASKSPAGPGSPDARRTPSGNPVANRAGQVGARPEGERTVADKAANKVGEKGATAAASTVGLGGVAEATGASKIAGNLAEKVFARKVRRIQYAVSLLVGVVIVSMLFVVTSGALFDKDSSQFPLPGDPTRTELSDIDLAGELPEDSGVEFETVADMLPPGWAQVSYEAQENTAGRTFGIPWTVIAGLARVQTDFGRRSPYDSADRFPDRDPVYGLPPGATGSSGALTVGTSYEGPVLLLGDATLAAITGQLATEVDNPLEPAVADTLGGLAGAVPSSDVPDVVAVAVAVPDDVSNPALLRRQISAVLRKTGKGSTVYWATTWDPTRREASATFNDQLRAVAKDSDRLEIIDFAAQARERTLVKRDGTLNPKGQATLARLFRNAIQSAVASSGWVLPVAKGAFRPSAYFHQYGPYWTWKGWHTGEDFAAPTGTPVLAASSGTVIRDEYNSSYGNLVVLSHPNGLQSWYAHHSKVFVNVGDTVSAGEKIGEVGETGNVTGPHLHFEIRKADGQSLLDPKNYLPPFRTGVSATVAEFLDALFAGPEAFEHGHGDADHGHGDLDTTLPHIPRSPATPVAARGPGLFAEGEACPVAVLSPAIGGGRREAAGAFLLRPAALAQMKQEGLDPQNPCEQATFVAEQLTTVGYEVYREGEYEDWEDDTEVAKQLWVDVINASNLFADPTNGNSECTVEGNPTEPAAVAAAIRHAFNCEVSLSTRAVEVVTGVDRDGAGTTFSTVLGRDAADQLATEAITTASAFSGLDGSVCVRRNGYAGVFPLTAADARAIGVADRCDTAGVIEALAAHVVSGETGDPSSRGAGGPFAGMLGGWADLSAAAPNPRLFARTGPRQPWEPSERCVNAIRSQLTAAARTQVDTLDALVSEPVVPSTRREVRRVLAAAGDPRAGACPGAADADYWGRLVVIAESLSEVAARPDRAGEPPVGDLPTPAVDPADEVDGIDDPFATGPGTSSPTTGPDSVPAPVGDLALSRRYLLFASVASAEARAAEESAGRAKVGQHALVARLALTDARIPSPVDDGRGLVPEGGYPTAAAAVEYALGYGGINPETYDHVDASVLDGTNIDIAGLSGGGADVQTVIAAAKSQLGVDYSWGGGGASGPTFGIEHGSSIRGFDCSGLMEYAFAKAGYSIGGTSNAQKVAGQAVTGGLAAAKPGDLLFWGAPTTYHVALYLGNGSMIHAPRTGDVVKIAAVSSMGAPVSYIRRVIPPGAGGSIGVSGGPGTDALAAKLPEAGKPYAGLFVAAGRKHGVDPALLAAMAYQESAFRPEVIDCSVASSAGAQGIMQFMPATAAGMNVRPCQPESAIDGGARYIKQLINSQGSLERGLASYNWGPGNVNSGGAWPAETRAYVSEIPARCRTYGGCRRS